MKKHQKGQHFRVPSDNYDEEIDQIEGRSRRLSQFSHQPPHSGGMAFGTPMNKGQKGGFNNRQGSDLGNSFDVGGSPFQRKHTYFRGDDDHAMDIDGSDDDSDEFDELEVNMDTGEHKKKKYKRMYDSKYKFPVMKKTVQEFKQTMNQGMSPEEAAERAKIQDKLLSYKRISNSFTTVLMGLSSIAMILLYIYIFIKLEERPYYITRSRVKVWETVEFERVQVSKL